jgi:hypothetical protein
MPAGGVNCTFTRAGAAANWQAVSAFLARL